MTAVVPESPPTCPATATTTAPGIIELRQYQLHPGRRDALVDLFEREFVETQEAVGMRLIGQFLDRDHDDRFVWLRGFADMPARAEALAAFYGGPVWKAHRDAANATMLDSDDVLLLRPVYLADGFTPGTGRRPPTGSVSTPDGLVVATLCHFDRPIDDDLLARVQPGLLAALDRAGAPALMVLASEYAANNFPALPVREGEHVLAWLQCFADEAAWQRHRAALAATPAWAEPGRLSTREPQVLRLAPTPRSLLPGSGRPAP